MINNKNMAELHKEVDFYVGNQIRKKRILLGLSQNDLGSKLGISFQQVQKYEKGINRLSSGHIYFISHVIKEPVTYLFDGLDNHLSPINKENEYTDPLSHHQFSKEIVEIVKLFYSIEDPSIRKHIKGLLKAFDQTSDI